MSHEAKMLSGYANCYRMLSDPAFKEYAAFCALDWARLIIAGNY